MIQALCGACAGQLVSDLGLVRGYGLPQWRHLDETSCPGDPVVDLQASTMEPNEDLLPDEVASFTVDFERDFGTVMTSAAVAAQLSRWLAHATTDAWAPRIDPVQVLPLLGAMLPHLSDLAMNLSRHLAREDRERRRTQLAGNAEGARRDSRLTVGARQDLIAVAELLTDAAIRASNAFTLAAIGSPDRPSPWGTDDGMAPRREDS
ncbi:hypothetical protein HDA40_001920 [Hamadaea flava]|uniref:Uncharacterized protein n=1 Tax=Hamadaea flava TaxID=1742688 RepID=A0ABV8LFE6_9ACTN|nr:hypothetical protein [Hamadaea flava]MCP2323413.1 hypothetical protein [Hamadaea flava]